MNELSSEFKFTMIKFMAYHLWGTSMTDHQVSPASLRQAEHYGIQVPIPQNKDVSRYELTSDCSSPLHKFVYFPYAYPCTKQYHSCSRTYLDAKGWSCVSYSTVRARLVFKCFLNEKSISRTLSNRPISLEAIIQVYLTAFIMKSAYSNIMQHTAICIIQSFVSTCQALVKRGSFLLSMFPARSMSKLRSGAKWIFEHWEYIFQLRVRYMIFSDHWIFLTQNPSFLFIKSLQTKESVVPGQNKSTCSQTLAWTAGM